MQPFPDKVLSVVVAPLIGGASLAQCLAALCLQPAREILVVAREMCEVPDGVRIILAPSQATMPERRAIGLEAATGPLVAFLEDTCIPSADWAAAISAVFADRGVMAAGGPVKIARTLTPRLRALAISEYSRHSGDRGRPMHEVDTLAGANFALRRDALAWHDLPKGLVDNFIFEAVRSAGGRIMFHPEASVTYSAGPPQQAQLSTRFHHGRIYGGLLTAQRPLASRILLASTAVAAPLVLLGRNLQDAGPQLLRSPATLGWTLLMHCAWGCGEIMGKLTGKVGASFKGWA